MAAGRSVRLAVGLVLGVGVLLLGAGWADARGAADEPEVRQATDRGVRERALTSAPGALAEVSAASTTVASYTRLGGSGRTSTEYDVVVASDGRVWASGWTTNVFDNGWDTLRAVTGASASVSLGLHTGRGHGLTVGPDGDVWFIGPKGIGRVTPSLSVVHPGFGWPGDITSGPGGMLWFVTYGPSSLLGRLDPATGQVVTIQAGLDYAEEIVVGPDGNLWITSGGNDRIVRVTPDLQVVSFASPSIDHPWGIDVGPDGNLWFASSGNDRIGRITPSGELTTYTDPSGRLDRPIGVVWGPGGYLYATSEANDRLAVVTTGGAMTTVAMPAGVGPSAITTDAANLYVMRGDDVIRVSGAPEPSAVTGLTATTPRFGAVLLEWALPASGASTVLGFRIYRDGAPVVDQTSTSIAIPESVPGQVHEYQVAVLHSGGEGPRATVAGAAVSTGTLAVALDGLDALSADVAFEGCAAAPNACGTFSLDDDTDPTLPSSLTAPGIVPGTYTITAAPLPNGYYLSSVSCAGATATTSLPDRRITVAFGSSETSATCTFRVRPTSITVELQVTGTLLSEIGFEGCGPTPSNCTGFALDVANSTATPSSVSFSSVPTGTYEVTLMDLPPGVSVTNVSCDVADGVADLANRRVTIIIGGAVKCTFRVNPTSVTTVLSGADVPAVGFGRCGPPAATCESFDLDQLAATATESTRVSSPLEPGTHTLTATTVPAGWTVTAISCNAGSPVVDLASNSVTLTLAQPNDATCTFTVAQARLDTVVDTPLGMRADVGFTWCGPTPEACETFALDDDSGLHPPTDPATLSDRRSLTGVTSGTYTLTLSSLPANALFDTIECSPGASVDLANRRVTMVVDGVLDDVDCTFRVSGPGLQVILDGTSENVGFEVCGPDGAVCVGYVLDDDGNNSPHVDRRGESGLAPGSYVMRLTDLPAGTTFVGVSCVGPGATIDTPNRQVTVALTTQTVACTFTVTG